MITEELKEKLNDEFRMDISHMQLGYEDNMPLDEFNRMLDILVNKAIKILMPTEQARSVVEPEVSLQNADGWKVRKKVGEPEETDRYLIAYRINGMTQIKFFTADYDTHYGWSNILDDIEIMAYKKIEFDSSILSN